jgi:hypothetical protein
VSLPSVHVTLTGISNLCPNCGDAQADEQEDCTDLHRGRPTRSDTIGVVEAGTLIIQACALSCKQRAAPVCEQVLSEPRQQAIAQGCAVATPVNNT